MGAFGSRLSEDNARDDDEAWSCCSQRHVPRFSRGDHWNDTVFAGGRSDFEPSRAPRDKGSLAATGTPVNAQTPGAGVKLISQSVGLVAEAQDSSLSREVRSCVTLICSPMRVYFARTRINALTHGYQPVLELRCAGDRAARKLLTCRCGPHDLLAHLPGAVAAVSEDCCRDRRF